MNDIIIKTNELCNTVNELAKPIIENKKTALEVAGLQKKKNSEIDTVVKGLILFVIAQSKTKIDLSKMVSVTMEDPYVKIEVPPGVDNAIEVIGVLIAWITSSAEAATGAVDIGT